MRVAIAVLVAISSASAAPARWQRLPLPPAMPKPADAGFVDVDGAKIYYAIHGKGAPVVLLHGGMGNSDHWAHQVIALADKIQLIVVDSRGHGRSTRSKASPSYDAMARDVLAVLDRLKVERSSVVGWSDGGEIALKLAIQHPERIDKLIVFAANYDARGSKPRSKPAATFNAYVRQCRADYERLSSTPKQFRELVAWLSPVWRKPMGFTKDHLRAIAAPTIIATGDHDEIIAMDQLEEMAKLIPNARLEVFKDTSHFAHWQDPATFNRVLESFLAAH